MLIRNYQSDDLTAVAELFTASVHTLATGYYDARQREVWAPRPPDPGLWQSRLAAIHTLVADDEGPLAGFIGYRDDGYIDLMFVSPDYAGHGVATRLYRQAESELMAAGIDKLTTDASEVARPFFERQGFEVIERQQIERQGVVFGRYAMAKICHSSI